MLNEQGVNIAWLSLALKTIFILRKKISIFFNSLKKFLSELTNSAGHLLIKLLMQVVGSLLIVQKVLTTMGGLKPSHQTYFVAI